MILIYGGAFNPPTLAHKQIMIDLMAMFKPSKFIFLPVGGSYNKPGLIDYKHRANMLNCFATNPDIIISDFEQQKVFKGTVSALDYFSRLYQDDVSFIMGADNLGDIFNWIEYERLLKTYQLIVIDRDNQAAIYLEKLKHLETHITIIDKDFKENASSIRTNKHAYKHYLDACVLAYIEKHHLYEG